MSVQFLNRIQTLDQLIKMKATGNPKALAMKMSISERTLYELLKLMRISGAPISYSKNRQSYFYKESGQFEIGFRLKRSKEATEIGN
jgi:hypothetical protein